jgi:hypothetical protein
MPFRPPRKQPGFADLKGILSQSKQTDNALYQTVQVLIERLMQFQGITVDRLDQLKIGLDELEGIIRGLEESGVDDLIIAYAPMSTGAEPLEIMSNGAGAVLMVGFHE